MTTEKYGFVYLWFDRKHKRYYVGCHWGTIDDGYLCSSNWMRDAYKRRPEDFKRRILKTNIQHRPDMYLEEQRYFDMIKPEELRIRYYNLCLSVKNNWHKYPEHVKTIGQKISSSKTGKKVNFSDPIARGKAISAGKKGKALTEEHKEALRGIKKSPHTVEWKAANSERMLEQWSNGSRKRKDPVKKMTIEEQAELSSSRLKSKWADPIWAAAQREKLKAGSAKRYSKTK